MLVNYINKPILFRYGSALSKFLLLIILNSITTSIEFIELTYIFILTAFITIFAPIDYFQYSQIIYTKNNKILSGRVYIVENIISLITCSIAIIALTFITNIINFYSIGFIVSELIVASLGRVFYISDIKFKGTDFVFYKTAPLLIIFFFIDFSYGKVTLNTILLIYIISNIFILILFNSKLLNYIELKKIKIILLIKRGLSFSKLIFISTVGFQLLNIVEKTNIKDITGSDNSIAIANYLFIYSLSVFVVNIMDIHVYRDAFLEFIKNKNSPKNKINSLLKINSLKTIKYYFIYGFIITTIAGPSYLIYKGENIKQILTLAFIVLVYNFFNVLINLTEYYYIAIKKLNVLAYSNAIALVFFVFLIYIFKLNNIYTLSLAFTTSLLILLIVRIKKLN